MRFVADGMLGKLARWLRMLGYDVKYFNNLDDEELAEVAGSEERILLTRDVGLYRKASVKGLQAFLIEGKTEYEKLAELAKRYGLSLEVDTSNSRCPKCNSNIRPVRKEAVLGKIPKSTSEFYDEFWECPNCGKIYWQGSHWERISKTLSRAAEILENRQ